MFLGRLCINQVSPVALDLTVRKHRKIIKLSTLEIEFICRSTEVHVSGPGIAADTRTEVQLESNNQGIIL